jgi:hypothetical protein
MMLPNELVNILDRARASLVSHPQHDLTLGFRRAIWGTMGPLADRTLGEETVAWRRRVRLAKASAEFVLPLWDRVWPEDDTPRRLLAEADRVVGGRWSPRVQGALWHRFFDNAALQFGGEDRDHRNAREVLLSANQALATAMWDERFDPGVIDLGLTDAEVDPDASDASAFACAAYAGGGVWDADSDSDRRREFWSWWLDEAVPNAHISVA